MLKFNFKRKYSAFTALSLFCSHAAKVRIWRTRSPSRSLCFHSISIAACLFRLFSSQPLAVTVVPALVGKIRERTVLRLVIVPWQIAF